MHDVFALIDKFDLVSSFNFRSLNFSLCIHFILVYFSLFFLYLFEIYFYYMTPLEHYTPSDSQSKISNNDKPKITTTKMKEK